MEEKNLEILKKLRSLRESIYSKHIEKQIGIWLANTSTANYDSHNHPQPPHQATAPPSFKPLSRYEEEEKTIGCLLSNIKHLESYDTDATESVSSNDSYDELEDFSHEELPPKKTTSTSASTATTSTQLAINQGEQDPTDLKKKAIWKWAVERSQLASRWTWLQAQIADLEYRIRAQNEASLQARSFKTPPLPPVLPENSCSRTVPISKDFRRRRLIKSAKTLSDSNKKLVKFSHVPCVCSSLPQTVAPCLSCNGRYNYLISLDGENASISERISSLDPNCHPVLSSAEDLTLGSQLAYLLKQETINKKPTKGRPGRKKGSTAEKLAAAAAAVAAVAGTNGGDKFNGNGAKFTYGKKAKYNMPGRPRLKDAASRALAASNKLKRKYRHSNDRTTGGSYNNQNDNYNNNWVSNGRSGSHSNNRRNKRVRSTSSMNENSMCSESSNHYRPNNVSAQNVSRRRRSEQSAYDIDNIVIPFSVAATTRVEILEYKEIVTPSWRVLENGSCPPEAKEEEEEDISDEAYINRHFKPEVEEKKRFSLKPPPKNTTTSTTTATTNETATSTTQPLPLTSASTPATAATTPTLPPATSITPPAEFDSMNSSPDS